ncbi:MAG TPA: hypothetical protein VK001_03215 [Geminicoccaceae bacterium]|nr:hypothetical protein [Geminicoccaceae bacterium]
MTNPASSTGRSWTTSQLAWSCIGSFVAGAVLLYAAGFHWIGQWQTGEEVAKKLAVAACMQQFLLQPDRGLIYTELKDTTSSFQRRQLIQKHSWATDREVATLCDQQIRALDEALFQVPEELPEEAAAGRQPA